MFWLGSPLSRHDDALLDDSSACGMIRNTASAYLQGAILDDDASYDQELSPAGPPPGFGRMVESQDDFPSQPQFPLAPSGWGCFSSKQQRSVSGEGGNGWWDAPQEGSKGGSNNSSTLLQSPPPACLPSLFIERFHSPTACPPEAPRTFAVSSGTRREVSPTSKAAGGQGSVVAGVAVAEPTPILSTASATTSATPDLHDCHSSTYQPSFATTSIPEWVEHGHDQHSARSSSTVASPAAPPARPQKSSLLRSQKVKHPSPSLPKKVARVCTGRTGKSDVLPPVAPPLPAALQLPPSLYRSVGKRKASNASSTSTASTISSSCLPQPAAKLPRTIPPQSQPGHGGMTGSLASHSSSRPMTPLGPAVAGPSHAARSFPVPSGPAPSLRKAPWEKERSSQGISSASGVRVAPTPQGMPSAMRHNHGPADRPTDVSFELPPQCFDIFRRQAEAYHRCWSGKMAELEPFHSQVAARPSHGVMHPLQGSFSPPHVVGTSLE